MQGTFKMEFSKIQSYLWFGGRMLQQPFSAEGLIPGSGEYLNYVYYNSIYCHAWNTVVMLGLVLLVATWNYWVIYKYRYAELLVLHLLPLLNIWLIVEM